MIDFHSNFESHLYNPPNFAEINEESCKKSKQQMQFKHGTFYMNQINSFKKWSLM